ncbi:MAG: MtrB/PioB family outer membrane beta-barrel protein, partial [Xanthomonadales bacterium]|nr:MtrB/PioB family outer membrane beta-barrel protein [Xanthomonadales bacterium]
MISRNHTVLSIIALSCLLFSWACWAQEKTENEPKGEDKKEQKKESVVDNEVELGLYYLSDDSFRYGKYSGLTDEGVYALLDFKLEKRPAWNSGDLTRWRFQGWRAGLNSRRFVFDFSQQGKQRFRFDYRQIPNNRFSNGLTPYMGLGGDELRMPVGWEIADGSNNTRGFINLDDYLRPYEIKTDRKSITLGYDLKI